MTLSITTLQSSDQWLEQIKIRLSIAPHLTGDASADAEGFSAAARGFDEDVALDDLPPGGGATNGDETPF